MTSEAEPLRRSKRQLVIADGRAADAVAFEQEMVGFFVDAAEILGVPKSVAAIYGICFASAEPLGFTEIQQRLDISAGSISTGLRVLREIGALKVVVSPLEKRDRYQPDMELRKLAVHFIENRLEKQLKSGKTRLKALATAVPEHGDAATKELRDRLKYLQSWQGKAEKLIPLVRVALSAG